MDIKKGKTNKQTMLSRVRGQGSLEFLMTYGWVMVALVVVLVVMWQWGLFSLGESIEPGSFGFWGVAPQNGNEFILHQDGKLELGVINQVGGNVTIYNVTASIGRFNETCEYQAAGCVKTIGGEDSWEIPAGEARVIELTNAGWAEQSGTRFEARVRIVYKDLRTGENIYQSSGRIWGNIEL